MKQKNQMEQWIPCALLGLTLACWPGAASSQTVTIPMPPGAIQPGGDPTDTTLDWGTWWNGTGTNTEVFDPTVSSSTSIPGSIHVTAILPGAAANPGAGANLCFGDFITAGIGNNNWLGANESSDVDFSLYSALSFDILVNINTSSNTDIPIYLFDWNYDTYQIGSVTIPATQGWQHISIPIPNTFSFNDTNAPPPNGTAWGFYYWYPDTPPACSDFWIDNVQLVGEGVIPPPRMTPPVKAVQGLNAFATTDQNSVWDRQGVMLVASNGLSWVGRASAAKPVSYSYTIKGFPTGPNIAYNTDAYLFLAPNPSAEENAPDWVETNCAMVEVASTGNGGGQMEFLYKVNEPDANAMYWGNSPYTNAPGSWDGVTPNYLESGYLTNVQSAQLLGTWTVQFTSDTNGTLIAPDGTTSSFIFPPYNVTKFAETNGFNVYLGMVANNANAFGQAVVYSSFAISNVPSAVSDNFLADTSLNTSIWNPSLSIGPGSVFIAPSNALYWVQWTLPATGFSLANSGSLGTNAAWNNVTTYTPLSTINASQQALSQQLISTSDLPPGNAAFFSLIKRAATQLLILLPGETNAPNTATGKTGTPNPVDLSSVSGVTFTVLTVDDQWYPVAGNNDTIEITSSDPAGFVSGANPVALNNGSVQIDWYFGTPGTQTITATDTTNPNILPNTDTVSVLNQ
ncbi:MAG: hypothetical protein ACLQU3_23010 [Limisphaerales bacterium]